MSVPTDPVIEALQFMETGVAVYDANRNLIYANPRFQITRGLPDAVVTQGAPFDDLIRASSMRGDFGPGRVEDHLKDRIAEFWDKPGGQFEREMGDGKILRIHHSRTNSGGLLISVEDRTDERRSQAALELSEDRHALVSRATSDGIYDWDVVNDLVYVSDRLREFMKFDADVQHSAAWVEHIHPADKDQYTKAMRQLFKGDAPTLDCEYRMRYEGKGYRTVNNRAVAQRNDEGRVVRIVGAVRDITHIKEAESELDIVERRLLASLEASSDGMLIIDTDDRVELSNARYAEIVSRGAGTDFSDKIYSGRPFFEMITEFYERGVFMPHPGGLKGWISSRRGAWQEPKAQWEVQMSDGTWILLNERRIPGGGRVSCYTDITDVKRREAEEKSLREDLQQAAEREAEERRMLETRMRKDTLHLEWLLQLAKFLRHEVRQPLASIYTSLDLITLAATDNEDVENRAAIARTAVEQIGNLIDRASLATDAEAFVRRANRQPTDLAAIARDVLRGFQQEQMEGLSFALDCEPVALALVDAVQITEALVNLLSNAVSYAHDNSLIMLRVKTTSQIATLEVVNQGPCIEESEEFLFRAFGSTRAGRSSEHHGLGLYVVRLIAEHHGGTATIANLDDGSGVCAAIRIPLLTPRAKPPAHEGSPS